MFFINFSSHPLDTLNSTLSALPSLGAISWYGKSAFFMKAFDRRKIIQPIMLSSKFSFKDLASAPSSRFLNYPFFVLIKLGTLFLFFCYSEILFSSTTYFCPEALLPLILKYLTASISFSLGKSEGFYPWETFRLHLLIFHSHSFFVNYAEHNNSNT